MTSHAKADTKSKEPVAVWPDAPNPLVAYSPAVKSAGWVFYSGAVASDFQSGLAPEVRRENPFLGSDMERQSRYLLKYLEKTTRAAGCDIRNDVVRIWQWFVSDYPTPQEFEQGNTWPRISITPYLEVRNEFISEPRPASTGMAVRQLPIRNTRVEVDMICIDDGNKSIGYAVPDGLPSPLAGYSPAIRRGDWIFLAGEIPVDWQGDYLSPVHMGEPSALAKEARINPYLWYGSSIEKQTDYVLQKLDKIAHAAGTSLDRAVKAEVYIGHPSDFAGMDRVWKHWFPKNPPARIVIPYMGLGGKGSRVEIALTLLTSDAKLKRETIETSAAPPPLGHEPQAVKVGNHLFISTQMAFDAKGKLADGMERNPEFPWYGMPGKLQMRYILKNVAAICEKAGTNLQNVVRRACFHDDERWFAESFEEWAAHFPNRKPTSTTMKIGGPLIVPGAHILLDLIAYVPD